MPSSLQTGTLQCRFPDDDGAGSLHAGFLCEGCWGLQVRGSSAHSQLDGGAAVVVHEPAGVVVAIAPWNAPYTIMMNKLAPALLGRLLP
jgi:hypothetical protein